MKLMFENKKKKKKISLKTRDKKFSVEFLQALHNLSDTKIF